MIGGYDYDLDDIPLQVELYMGTNPFKPTLLLEIDYMDGFAPSKDVNDVDGDGDTEEYIVLDYVKKRFDGRGVELIYKVDEKIDSKTTAEAIDLFQYRALHHWKLYYVYICYVNRMWNNREGNSNIVFGAAIGKGRIDERWSYYSLETRVKIETIILLHEIGHCIWINVAEQLVGYCPDKTCVMHGFEEDFVPADIDAQFENGYCDLCWSQHSLLSKYSTILTKKI